MKIHEYQGKQIVARYGVPVPRGEVTDDPKKARELCERFGGRCVVKAQIHAGGRGKGGGVKLAKSPDEAEQHARAILGMQLVTLQTGPKGQKVRKVLVEEALAIAQELYLGITLDRRARKPVMMASRHGGMEIEVVAERDPHAILRETFDAATGLSPFQARRLAYGLGLAGDIGKKAVTFMIALARAYVDSDASLAEINPLLITEDGSVLALDAKMTFDDNALFRHPEIKEMRDLEEEDPLEIEASKFGLNYIKLDGSVACMVNGAGLAMATMDIIKLAGGEPANFLDVGGGASENQVKNAFRLLLSDPAVRAVLVNIFGGIMRCDIIAQGVVAAAREVTLSVPLVVRLEGTNVEQGQQILRDSGLPIIVADGMADAARKVVDAAAGAGVGAKS